MLVKKAMEGHKIPLRKNIFEAIYSKVSKLITPLVAKTSLTPNAITIYAGVCGLVGGLLLLSSNRYVLIGAGVLIHLFILFDLVDGDLARIKGMCSTYGQWLDGFIDKLNEFIIILGLAVGVYRSTGKVTVLVAGLLLMGFHFLIHFYMVYSQTLVKDEKRENPIGIETINGALPEKRYSVRLLKSKQFIFKHLLMERVCFLFLIGLAAILNILFFGLWFLTVYALITLILQAVGNFYSLRYVVKA